MNETDEAPAAETGGPRGSLVGTSPGRSLRPVAGEK